jgi:hypothetical protein
VELAPPFLPARLDGADRDVREVVSELPLTGGVGVDRELSRGFLEALRVKFEQTRPCLF